jgi:hypothetical protein
MKRSTPYQKLPWSGGVNTSVDPGVLNDNELVLADNVVFNIAGSRLKRDGLTYFDSDIPAPATRSSAGTTRTLKFTDNGITLSSAQTDEKLVVGEKINVTGLTNYNVTNGVILSLTTIGTEDFITYTAVGSLTEAETVATGGVVERSAKILNFRDYWRYDTANDIQAQLGMAVTSQGFVFRYDSQGRRVQIHGQEQVTTVTVPTPTGVAEIYRTSIQGAGAITSGEYFTFSNAANQTNYYVWYNKDGAGGNPNLVGATGIEVAILAADGSASVTTKTNTALQAFSAHFTTQVVGVEIIFTNVRVGVATDIDDGTSGFTVSVDTQGSFALTSGEYFNLYAGNNTTKYYVWFNIADAGGDPMLASSTGIEVELVGNETNLEIAEAIKLVLDDEADFSATRLNNVVTITATAPGITTASSDGNTGLTVATTESGATVPVIDAERVQTIVFNNRFLIYFNTLGDKPIMYYPEDSAKYELVPGSPDASFVTEYLSRLWVNKKTDPHRLEYCSTADHTEWGGTGDSGALDISPGDGDPEGLTTAYAFKTTLFTHKKLKMYRVDGTTPENFAVNPVSGPGAESQFVAPIDEDDVIFTSKKGFHTLIATDQFGDTSSNYLSAKIQPTFTGWNQNRLKSLQSIYIPELNSVAFGVSSRGQQENDELWFYNTTFKAWYRWPNISCEAVSRRLVANTNRLILGTTNGRLIQAQSGDYYDFDEQAITYKVKTGTIYPGNNPQSWKAFRALTFFYKPKGDFVFTAKVKIDNQQVQVLTFEQVAPSDRLGVDFILGSSLLGVDGVLAPYTFYMSGYGRGMTIEIEQSGLNEQVEIYGFTVEYEEEGLRNEVLT